MATSLRRRRSPERARATSPLTTAAPPAAPPLPTSAPPEGSRSSLLTAAVVAVVVLGVVLRFLTSSHLWLDEALPVTIARRPLSRIPDALRHDGSPPLYYLALHFWSAVFGASDAA